MCYNDIIKKCKQGQTALLFMEETWQRNAKIKTKRKKAASASKGDLQWKRL